MPAITDWPADDRPREKLLLKGANALSDAELLAIFLRTGIAGMTAVDLARYLLQHFGSLRAVLTAGEAEFCQAKGLGRAKYAQLQAVLEMARRHFEQPLQRGQALSDPADSKRYLHQQLRDEAHEVFACLFLDNRHRVIKLERLFRGSIDGAAVYPREVVKAALAAGAAAVVFAHNHPSGNPEPSTADEQITKKLRTALSSVDIRVLDHIIIGDCSTVSLAERGLM